MFIGLEIYELWNILVRQEGVGTMASARVTEEQRELYRTHAEVLQVLANPLRHELVHLLAEADRSAGELVTMTGASKSNVSQHIAQLRAYGLVQTSKQGRSVTYRLAYPQLAEACRLIDEILLDQARKSARLHGQSARSESADADGDGRFA